MNKVCKIRFYPTNYQIKLINNTLGCCRFINNKYIEYNKSEYSKCNKFIGAYEFDKILNKLKKVNDDYKWINNYSTKAIKAAEQDVEKNYKRFFKGLGGYPKFISRKRLTKESFYFIKDNIHFDTYSKYIISIPILGKIRILQKDYLPDIFSISSGRVIKDHNKYYVMFIYTYIPNKLHNKNKDLHIGIDLGIKNYASIYLSNGNKYYMKHYKDDTKYKEIKNKIIKLQQVISYKAKINYGRLLNKYLDNHNGEEPNENYKNIMKGESYNTSNIRKLNKRISRLYDKLHNIRIDYINKLVYTLVARTKPSSITIEDLSVSNMLQNDNTSKLHEQLQDSMMYYFRQCITNKCLEYNIELRIANRLYASSKICSNCGHKKKGLKLTDRIYRCTACGYEEDRDMNAVINLCNLKKKYYEVII